MVRDSLKFDKKIRFLHAATILRFEEKISFYVSQIVGEFY
jgi:hypothetical protein